MSEAEPCIAASPDANVDCSHKESGKFLVEVNSLFTHRNMHLKQAMKANNFCEKDEAGEYQAKATHGYYHQIQCQRAVTGIHRSYLYIYTKKAIQTILVKFGAMFWGDVCLRL